MYSMVFVNMQYAVYYLSTHSMLCLSTHSMFVNTQYIMFVNTQYVCQHTVWYRSTHNMFVNTLSTYKRMFVNTEYGVSQHTISHLSHHITSNTHTHTHTHTQHNTTQHNTTQHNTHTHTWHHLMQGPDVVVGDSPLWAHLVHKAGHKLCHCCGHVCRFCFIKPTLCIIAVALTNAVKKLAHE